VFGGGWKGGYSEFKTARCGTATEAGGVVVCSEWLLSSIVMFKMLLQDLAFE
jgi:hypothetical protein